MVLAGKLQKFNCSIQAQLVDLHVVKRKKSMLEVGGASRHIPYSLLLAMNCNSLQEAIGCGRSTRIP